MSLLQKASIITTPTAYAEDYLYSIKPALKVSNTELITNGNFSNGLTNWTASSSAPTLNADNTVTFDSSTEFIFQSISVTVGRRYRLTFGGTGNLRYRTGFAGTDAPTKEIVLPAVIDIVATSNTNRVQPYGSTLGTGILKSISLKEVTDADIDFTRNSTGTRLNEDYLIERVPYNLMSYSEDFSNAAYTKYNASIAETTIQSPISGSYVESISNTSTGTTFSFINQNTPTDTASDSVSTFSVYAKKGTFNRIGISNRSGDTFGVIYDLDNGTVIDTNSNTGQILASSIQSAGNGFYLCSVTLDKSNQYNIHPLPNDASTASLLLTTLSYTETGNVNIFGAQAVMGANLKPYLKTTDKLDIPRIDYTNGEPSILLEPQRQNLVINSNNASSVTGNLVSNIQINSSNNLSPEGINNAQEIEVTGVSQPRVESVVISNATVYAISAYVKKVTGDFFGLGFYQGDIGNQFAKFNLDTGTFVAVQSNGAVSQSATNIYNCEIIAYKNNWYRITCNILTGSNASKSNIKWLAMSEGTSTFSSGVVGDKFLIYGRQVEQASYPTSLIHTSGSAVTRSQDVGSNAGNSDLISSVEGVLYAEVNFKNVAAGTYISISNAAGNRILIGTENGTGRVYGSSLVTTFSIDYDRYNKIAYSYKANQRKIFLNGESIYSSTASYTVPTGMNELSFDSTGGGSQDTEGNVKSVMVFKEALTDAELEKLTGYNNHELYMNYYNRLSYLGLVEEYNVESDINNYIL